MIVVVKLVLQRSRRFNCVGCYCQLLKTVAQIYLNKAQCMMVIGAWSTTSATSEISPYLPPPALDLIYIISFECQNIHYKIYALNNSHNAVLLCH